MKNPILLIVLLFCFVSCQSQVKEMDIKEPQETQLKKFEKFKLLKSDNKIDTVRARYLLTNTNEKIDMTFEEINRVINAKAEGKPYSEVENLLFNAIQYRFFSRLKFEENNVVITVKNGAEIGVPEFYFKEIKKSMDVMNSNLSKSSTKTIEKQFEYLKLLIKDLSDFNSIMYKNDKFTVDNHKPFYF